MLVYFNSFGFFFCLSYSNFILDSFALIRYHDSCQRQYVLMPENHGSNTLFILLFNCKIKHKNRMKCKKWKKKKIRKTNETAMWNKRRERWRKSKRDPLIRITGIMEYLLFHFFNFFSFFHFFVFQKNEKDKEEV